MANDKENNQNKDFDEVLSEYVDRTISIIENNPVLSWIPICSDMKKISKKEDSKELKNSKNKNKFEVFANFAEDISKSMLFLKFIKKLGKIINNREAYKEGKKYKDFLSMDKFLENIEKDIVKIKTKR